MNSIPLLPVFLLFLLASERTLSQGTDDPIDRGLRMVDLPSFEWSGQPDPIPPRLGIYTTPLPADSLRMVAGIPAGAAGWRIWHTMPHWSADEAGMLIGDIVVMLNGRSIGDSIAQGDDYINLTIRGMRPGDTARFTIVRNGAMQNLAVPLVAATRVPMPFVNSFAEMGDLRSGSWLQGTLEKLGMVEWSRIIQKQMRVIADQDFCTVQFAGRPNPWRLNAVTYLHHNPTRLGAYSRLMAHDLWKGAGSARGLSNAVIAAARQIDINAALLPASTLPTSSDELDRYLARVQVVLDSAYAPVRSDIVRMTTSLERILDMENDWEVALDSIRDPRLRREERNRRERELGDLFAKADRVDLPSLVRSAAMLAELADTTWLRRFSATASASASKPRSGSIQGVEGRIIRAWKTPRGLIVIGGPGPNRYKGDFRCIIDVGGDDIYELPALQPGLLRFIGDLNGDDLYSGMVGSGRGGIDIVADAAGDDIYRGRNYTQGAGLLGVGLLADFGGDDTYRARACSQGGAFLGVGLLWEGGGMDSYESEVYSQGFGYIKGIGVILEVGGNDSYRAGWKYPDSRYPNRAHLAMSQGFGYGMRPWTTGIGTDGGIGVLADRAGDDLYASDYFSQGGSYWYALGVLHDAAGADRYTAGQYSQGSGIHLSFGALLDDSGDDMYDAYAGLEQGNAHDWSAGCLEDLQGNDTYRGSSSSQGSALNVSFAWLLDGAGNDQYYALLTDTTHSQGGGNYNFPRRHGSLGMLLDLGSGADFYVEPRVIPGVAVAKGNRGLVYDDGVPEGNSR